MPSNAPYAGSAGIRRIISDLERTRVQTSPLERGVLRNCAAKAERVEKAQLLAFFNSLPAADLARIGAAMSRLEKRAESNALHASMARLRMGRLETRRDLRALRQLFSGR